GALARERKACLTRELGPLAANEVGDRHEGPPVVGGAVVERLRYLRVGVDELLEVVGRPARGLAPQSLEPFVIPPTQALDLCALRLALYLNDDGPVLPRVLRRAAFCDRP